MKIGERQEWLKTKTPKQRVNFYKQEFKDMQKCEYCHRKYTKKNYPVMVFLDDKPISVCLKCVKYEWFEKATKYTEKFD